MLIEISQMCAALKNSKLFKELRSIPKNQNTIVFIFAFYVPIHLILFSC